MKEQKYKLFKKELDKILNDEEQSIVMDLRIRELYYKQYENTTIYNNP